MELSGSKQETLTRLAVCDRGPDPLLQRKTPVFCPETPTVGGIPPLAGKNRIQAIAVVSARSLFGLSLALFPLEASRRRSHPLRRRFSARG